MAVRKIKEDIYSVGAIDFDRRLFDELIPLPEGTSYNSYLVVGSEKTALLDTVDPTKVGALVENLNELNVGKIDYLVAPSRRAGPFRLDPLSFGTVSDGQGPDQRQMPGALDLPSPGPRR